MYSALETGIHIESTVGIIGAFKGIDLAILEGFLPTGPACEVFGGWILDFLCSMLDVAESEGTGI
jgi:hypothetical protein